MTISKKVLGVALVVVMAVSAVAYFVLFSPKDSNLTYSLEYTSLPSNQEQTVTGTVDPAEGDRLILIEVKGSASWVEATRTTTDSSGKFAISFPMTERGTAEIRVRAESKGRQKAVSATPQTVKVLDPTQVEAQIPRFARADKPLRVSGRVIPAGSRTVFVETSNDGQTWSTAGQASTRAESGKYTVSATGLAQGTLQVRVAVEEADTSAAFVGEPKPVKVEDYKAAGRRYLSIVGPTNKLRDELNAADAGTNLERFTVVAARLSKAETLEVKRLRGYAYWPREVKPSIALLAQSGVIWADYHNRLSHADDFDDAYAISWPKDAKGADNAPALIRAALGLPKRD